MSAADTLQRWLRLSHFRSYFWRLSILLGRWPRRIIAGALFAAAALATFQPHNAHVVKPPVLSTPSAQPDRPLSVLGNPDMRAVPLRLSDPQIGQLLHRGDHIDVLAVPDSFDDVVAAGEVGARKGADFLASKLAADAVVAAADVPVITVIAKPDAGDQSTLVLVAAPERIARRLAAANMRGSLTVTLRAAHGDSELPNTKDDHAQ